MQIVLVGKGLAYSIALSNSSSDTVAKDVA
jgi:hypothetical protein